MKIAFIICPTAVVTQLSNGIRSQALAWAQGLEQLGHEVVLLSPWDVVSLKSFDVIHLFGPGMWLEGLVSSLAAINPRIALSPILDTTKPQWLYKIASRVGCSKLGITSNPYFLRSLRPHVKQVLVRSAHERVIFERILDFRPGTVATVLLGCRFSVSSETLNNLSSRAGVLHVSSLHQKRKNVVRLIRVCESLGVPLRLAGSLNRTEDGRVIETLLRGSRFCSYLGFLTEEELRHEYSRAKVFCLPSLYEGVGQVALEAASFGCDIVITRNGGPLDYFKERAWYVEPTSEKDLTNKIRAALQKSYQPQLAEYIRNSLSLRGSCEALLGKYRSLNPSTEGTL